MMDFLPALAFGFNFGRNNFLLFARSPLSEISYSQMLAVVYSRPCVVTEVGDGDGDRPYRFDIWRTTVSSQSLSFFCLERRRLPDDPFFVFNRNKSGQSRSTSIRQPASWLRSQHVWIHFPPDHSKTSAHASVLLDETFSILKMSF